ALHEVGHTVGLRHNFAGSYDALNYPKQYWDLRTANGTKVPRPRHLEEPTKAELEGLVMPNGLRAGISEFQASSIMDYGANFNSDIQGLGKYDAAALKFGYGQLVEVFTDVKNPYLMGALQASVSYGSALPILVDCSGNDYVVSHYSKLPTLVGIEARATVPLSSLKREILSPTCAYPDEVEVDAQKRMVVPYQFCSDEFEAASTGCEAFDRGADPFEVASSAMTQYRNYYLFDAFRRERLGFNPDWSLDRLYGRYLGTLRTMMQFYVLDKAYYDGAVTPAFWTSADGYGPYTVAVTQTFDFLGEMLMMPEPGKYFTYSGDDNRDAWYLDDYGTGTPGFTLGLGQARYFNTQWEYDSGYFWYERVRNVGSFVDKVAALAELTDPETYFIGKDVAADLREFSINYWRLYPRQMLDVYGAALTDRWDRLAPVFDGTSYKHRPISSTITIPPAGTLPVDPALGFTVQLWMASLGSALIPATFDPTFSDSTRVWLAGNGAQINSTLPLVTFADPYSGKTYTAVSYLSGILETGVAARMISRANELKALLDPQEPYTTAALKSYLQLLEAQRSISEVYSNSVY
ncbi:MAG: MoxR-like ATPase, partial [Myxococcaceae bacterium]|nr:MoxR-like ATPase [Myxococcaceae bacterium]